MPRQIRRPTSRTIRWVGGLSSNGRRDTGPIVSDETTELPEGASQVAPPQQPPSEQRAMAKRAVVDGGMAGWRWTGSDGSIAQLGRGRRSGRTAREATIWQHAIDSRWQWKPENDTASRRGLTLVNLGPPRVADARQGVSRDSLRHRGSSLGLPGERASRWGRLPRREPRAGVMIATQPVLDGVAFDDGCSPRASTHAVCTLILGSAFCQPCAAGGPVGGGRGATPTPSPPCSLDAQQPPCLADATPEAGGRVETGGR